MAQQRDTVRLPAWLLEEAELVALHSRLVECMGNPANEAKSTVLRDAVIGRDGLRAIMRDRGMVVPQ